MLRAAVLLAFACAVGVVGAAPVPPPSEKERLATLWGKTEGVGEFELKGRQLVVRTAGQPARGFIRGKDMNMPRATRTVTGDFEATVTVFDADAPNPKNKHEDAWPGTRAGLFVAGGGYCVELHLYQYYPNRPGNPADKLVRTVWADAWYPTGGSGRSRGAVPEGQSVLLRVTRKDGAVSVSHSSDGKEWAPALALTAGGVGQKLDFPDEVTVGVFFAHSTHQAAAATFDALTITKPK